MSTENIYLSLRDRQCELAQVILESALSKIESLGVTVRVYRNRLNKRSLSYAIAEADPIRPGRPT